MRGTFSTDRGDASYVALPVEMADSSGLFVVGILLEAGRREIRDVQTYRIVVMPGVVLLGGVSAWIHHGFLIRDASENNGGPERQFHSREKAPDNPPQLVVTFARIAV